MLLGLQVSQGLPEPAPQDRPELKELLAPQVLRVPRVLQASEGLTEAPDRPVQRVPRAAVLQEQRE